MKTLVYKIEGYNGIYNPETEEVEQHLSLATVSIDNPTDTDIAQAQKIAYNGEYTIEDDGQPEPEQPMTDAERIAQLEEALELLLSGAVE